MKTTTFIFLLLINPTLAFADYNQSPQQMAEKYQRESRELEDRNREKYNDLERRANEREIVRELREQQWQHEFDRMIDENR